MHACVIIIIIDHLNQEYDSKHECTTIVSFPLKYFFHKL